MVLVDEVNMLRRTDERIRGGFEGFQSTFQVSQSLREREFFSCQNQKQCHSSALVELCAEIYDRYLIIMCVKDFLFLC